MTGQGWWNKITASIAYLRLSNGGCDTLSTPHWEYRLEDIDGYFSPQDIKLDSITFIYVISMCVDRTHDKSYLFRLFSGQIQIVYPKVRPSPLIFFVNYYKLIMSIYVKSIFKLNESL